MILLKPHYVGILLLTTWGSISQDSSWVSDSFLTTGDTYISPMWSILLRRSSFNTFDVILNYLWSETSCHDLPSLVVKVSTSFFYFQLRIICADVFHIMSRAIFLMAITNWFICNSGTTVGNLFTNTMSAFTFKPVSSELTNGKYVDIHAAIQVPPTPKWVCVS